MEYLKSFIWKPSLDDQRRSCQSLIRSEVRGVDRSISNQINAENKARKLIQSAHQRAVLFSAPAPNSTVPRNAIGARAAQKEMRAMARELVALRKQTARLHTCKAQLQSVQMKVDEAFADRKIGASLREGAGVMKAVSGLVSMREMIGTARRLNEELMRAGVMEEMVDDIFDVGAEEEAEDEEELENEIQKVLQDVLRVKPGQEAAPGLAVPAAELEPELDLPDLGFPKLPTRQSEPAQENDSQDVMLEEMRGRLQALKG